AIVVNFNPLYVACELEHQVKDSGTTVMVVPDIRAIHEKVAAIAEPAGLRRIIVCPIADILPPASAIAYRLMGKADARPPKDSRHVSYARVVRRDADP